MEILSSFYFFINLSSTFILLYSCLHNYILVMCTSNCIVYDVPLWFTGINDGELKKVSICYCTEAVSVSLSEKNCFWSRINSTVEVYASSIKSWHEISHHRRIAFFFFLNILFKSSVGDWKMKLGQLTVQYLEL